MRKYLFIPSSYSKDVRDERLRVFKIGILGRTAAIFRIDKIIVYDDKDAKIEGRKEAAYMKDVLE
ncbi:MAG: RNA-binding protein, partial [Candidatus Aenigmarchaeota archaeon]|nr:RNA-binding protein [Candidatus Aenigmarchaeota archaeon]